MAGLHISQHKIKQSKKQKNKISQKINVAALEGWSSCPKHGQGYSVSAAQFRVVHDITPLL